MTKSDLVTTQWHVISRIIDNPSDLYTTNHTLFTGKPLEVYNYMREADKRDELTPQGIEARFGLIPELVVAHGSTTNIKPLVRELATAALRRELRAKSKQLADLANQSQVSVEEVRGALFLDAVTGIQDVSIVSGAEIYLQELRAKRNGTYKYARTGLTFLDRKIGGEYKPGTLTIVMGAGGSGKTTFALNSMYRMASSADATPSLFVSQEMRKSDLFARLLSDITNIYYGKLIDGSFLTEAELEAMDAAYQEIQRLPLYIVDTPQLPLSDIIYNIKHYVREFGIRVVFVDHLQCINHNTGNRVADLGTIAQELRDLAFTLGISVVLLSQITESNEGQERIRDSRTPAKIADVVCEFIMEQGSANDPVVHGQLHFYKNRFGKEGFHPVMFDGSHQRFESAE